MFTGSLWLPPAMLTWLWSMDNEHDCVCAVPQIKKFQYYSWTLIRWNILQHKWFCGFLLFCFVSPSMITLYLSPFVSWVISHSMKNNVFPLIHFLCGLAKWSDNQHWVTDLTVSGARKRFNLISVVTVDLNVWSRFMHKLYRLGLDNIWGWAMAA